MSSSPPESFAHHEPRETADVSTGTAASRWRPIAAVTGVALLVALNLWLDSPGFWRLVQATKATRFASYHPVALQLPNVLAPPAWVRGGSVILGASTVGASIPTERTMDRLGRRAWTVWASGARPPELLAMAPYVARGSPRHVLIGVEARMAGLGGETPFSAQNRSAYTGPLSPAWLYHQRQSALGVAGRVSAVAAVRFRPALRVLVSGWVRGRLIERRQPDPPAWRQIERYFDAPAAQAARATFQADPSVATYDAYLKAMGVAHEGIRVFWTDMRSLEPDLDGTGDNVQALLDTTRYFRERGIAVAWVLFPDNPFCSRLRGPDGRVMATPELRPHAQQLFRDLAAREDVPFLDLLNMAEAHEYVDYTHLTPPASDRFGRRVGAWLDEIDPLDGPGA